MLNSRAPFAVLLVACAAGLIAGCGGNSALSNLSAEEAAIIDAPPCARNTAAESMGMPSEERIFGWIRDLTLFGNRRTGSIGGMKAAAYMKCQFESLGLVDVHYETAQTMSWEARKSSLSVAGEPIDSSPVPFTMITSSKPNNFSTPPGGLNAELVDIGLGTPAEVYAKGVKGKIAVFDLKFLVPTLALAPLMEFFWDPGLTIADPSSLNPNPFQTQYSYIIKTIVDAGAVGYIGVLADYFDSNKYYNESYHLQLPVPGMWVAPKDGQKVRALMAASGNATANIVMEGKSNGEAIGRAVMGVLPGKSKDTILITSHHDAAWNGAVEDASGAASVLAQAQYFASQPAESREKTLLFATMDSHWTGYEVHKAFGQKYILDPNSPYKVVGDVSIEHIGKQGVKDADNKLKIVDQPEYRGIFENLSPALKQTMISGIIKHDLRRIALLDAVALCPTVGIPTDAFSCVAGVPTASLIAGPNYLYDEADTLDKIARDQLVPVARFFAELVEAMDATPSALIGVGIASPVVNPPSLP
ncbi:MAG: M28 family peptidase [Stagnimonas sp.]|nr:M28 family peptidase [Stagnimonas sp.]